LGWWLISKYCTQIQNGYQLIWKYFSQIPIALNKGNESLEKLVETILSLKEKDSKTDISELEQQIDLLVYHLYGLTYDEVLIVDSETPITREEYEKIE
jgi:adenine specific DNA methylase Mod